MFATYINTDMKHAVPNKIGGLYAATGVNALLVLVFEGNCWALFSVYIV
jgi:hypothetical protein